MPPRRNASAEIDTEGRLHNFAWLFAACSAGVESAQSVRARAQFHVAPNHGFLLLTNVDEEVSSSYGHIAKKPLMQVKDTSPPAIPGNLLT